MPAKIPYPQLLRANAWTRKAGDAFFWQCTTRTVQESKLFPVNPYIALSYFNAWYRWPELLRKIDRAMPAEELGDRARSDGSYASTITLGLIPQFYLGGRQILLDMGMLKPTDAIDDVTFVLDFCDRINLAYHRAHAHEVPSDAGQRGQILPERQAQVFEADAIRVVPGDRLHQSFGQFMATASAYGFLSHCECRLSFNNHGPYRTAGGGQLLVRDMVDLAECDYPWMDGVAGGIEHNNLTIPVVMKDTNFNIVDDWGSFEATPAYDADNITAVGCYTSDFLSDGWNPVAMGSADELADFFDRTRQEMSEATTRMWKMMAGWTREQMIDAGLLVYYAVIKDLAHYAGVYEQDDWFTIDERAQRFKPLFNDEYGGALIAEIVGLVSLSSQNGSEYHMAKHHDGRGEMWTPIPYSVLIDDEWTSTVGPLRPGTTSLPAKSAGYTTTRGKLTQDECNRQAAEFRPAGWEHRYLDDDTWVKHHADDPRAVESYRRAQASSRTLRDRGSGLHQDDLAGLDSVAVG
ncbi:MAG: hypothetical protein QOG59_662 [Solirubrobacteraceae bacterium]|jgi:hypothetical protein|nr:hypothetical protein [Solirubrobacteraceae bacterium]